ncbi:hypothetical protein [Hymenobacter coccineus]|uniref:Antitoxin VbhA domain-containing protein n=1 Tax=Hymenobacter coccineus TaxID=1908235 RepID=A0A1G1TMQ8_9BACT|nr:hypothetical protein [Hymenobacter coccineus]OGX92160.1 hypothetical protein BEN49_03775 [Hymenobacter coccineus]
MPSTILHWFAATSHSGEAQRRQSLADARARVQAWGEPQRNLSSDLYEAYAAGALSLLELRYAIEGRCHRRRTPACWRLLAA